MYKKGREGPEGRRDHSSVNMQSAEDMRMGFQHAQQVRHHYDDDEGECCKCKTAYFCFCLCIAVTVVIVLGVYFAGLMN